MDAMDLARQRLRSEGVADDAAIIGCSADEVAQVVVAQGTPIPWLYERFLRVMGKGAGDLLIGSDVYFPKVLGLRRAALGLLADCGHPFDLPQTTVVSLMHQGYQFLYFESAQPEDPPVMRFMEGWTAPRQAYKRFTDFLDGSIREAVSVRTTQRPVS
jgi:hypothetical protein